MVRMVEPLLGTRAEVAVVAASGDQLPTAEDEVLDEVARLEKVFSAFDERSELHRFRRTGAADAPELLDVSELAAEWHRRTRGAFHPGAQPLFDLWDHSEAVGITPSAEAITPVVAALGATLDPAMLNLNAIAKGWIAQRALDLVFDRSTAADSAWLNLGGDVVHRGAGSLAVGIEDPLRPYDNVAPMATVHLTDEALATSGGARRWWNIAGRRYPKVLDPRSGWPVEHLNSATVLAPDGATADVLATVAFVLSASDTLELVDRAGAECLLIGRDGTVTSSSERFLR